MYGTFTVHLRYMYGTCTVHARPNRGHVDSSEEIRQPISACVIVLFCFVLFF